MLLLWTDKIGFAGTTGLKVKGKLRLFIVVTLTWKLWTKALDQTRVLLFYRTCTKSLMDGPSGQQGLFCWPKHTHKSKLFFSVLTVAIGDFS